MTEKSKDAFWIALGKGVAICLTEAFASAAGSHMADRLLQKKDDKESDAE